MQTWLNLSYIITVSQKRNFTSISGVSLDFAKVERLQIRLEQTGSSTLAKSVHTPLHIASGLGHAEVVRRLLHLYHSFKKTYDIDDIWDMAKKHGHSEVLTVLRDYY